MKLSTIKKNPDNPRIIRDARFEQLKRSITEFPQMMALRPIVIDSDGVVLGGNMRLEALKALGHKDIPDEWVKRADELTAEQRREFIVKDNAGFGEWDWDALANGWDDLPLSDWGVDLPKDWLDASGGDAYSQKIEAPIYEPKGVKPAISELFDEEKVEGLVKEIASAEITDEEKDFLIKAAQRHRIFSYEKIADFYAHSGGIVQDLMEKSALVIIDFNKAVEFGYVELAEGIAEMYAKERADA